MLSILTDYVCLVLRRFFSEGWGSPYIDMFTMFLSKFDFRLLPLCCEKFSLSRVVPVLVAVLLMEQKRTGILLVLNLRLRTLLESLGLSFFPQFLFASISIYLNLN